MRFKHHQSALGRFLEDRTALFYNGWGAAILGLGAVMDYSMTGLWLPRAGAVVAGAAAYTYFFDPRTSDDWWELRRKGAMIDLALASPPEPQTPTGTKGEAMRARRMADQAALAQKLRAFAEKRDISKKAAMKATAQQHHRALQVQGFWVLLGTLVWAFGDIPVELMKCGAVPC